MSGTEYKTQVIQPNPFYADPNKQMKLNEAHRRGFFVMYKTNDAKYARYVITEAGVQQWTKELHSNR